MTVTPTVMPGGDSLAVSYASILKQVPKELYGKLAPAGAAGNQFSMARTQVLEQISHGAVKVSFGLLRQSAPAGLFINSSAYDGKLIDLPLGEILAQIEPKAFARRPDQRVVEVSPEVTDLFGPKGDRVVSNRPAGKTEAAKSAAAARPTVLVTTAPAAAKSSGSPAQRTATPATPMQPKPQVAPVTAAKPVPTQVPAPAAQLTKPVIPAKPVAPLPKVAARPAKPAPLLAPVTPVAADPSVFLLALAEVADCWPESVRQELAQLKLPDAKAAFSAAEMCEGLKRGKVQYPWKQVRASIQDAPAADAPSPHGETVLDFPLNIITPLFLDYIRSTPSQRKVGSAEHITEFFRKAKENAPGDSDFTEPDLPSVTYQKTVVAPLSSAPVTTVVPVVPAIPVSQPDPAPIVHRAPEPALPRVAATGPGSAEVDQVTFDAERGTLSVPLSRLSGAWPEPVLEEVTYFGLVNACVDLPLDVIQCGLKLGKVDHSWKEICSWISDCPPDALDSGNAETALPLPLNVIAPLYFKHRPGPNAPKKAAAAVSQIPDLFNPNTGRPSAAPAAPPVAAAPVAPAPPAGKPPRNLAELFGEPQKRNWSPNDIVHATSRLPGVAGALIALQDGLLVASCMPPSCNTETVAAFVPQMFGRMNQYAKELEKGAVESLSFGVELGTLQIFKTGVIYFAALSQRDRPLPMTELVFIASELNHHSS